MEKIPAQIKQIISTLTVADFEVYAVGGCVRDLLLGLEPKDWDITTNARPEQIQNIFADSKYENEFGTVLVKIKNEQGETEPFDNAQGKRVVEVTTYRSEQGYGDRRHPDEVVFEDALDKDLERRDFTINALAMDLTGKVVDLFGGQDDLKKKIIRAVGEPEDRFKEDALRLLRAVRFSCQLGFDLEPKTERAIVKLAGSLKFIAKERQRDELIKILQSPRSYEGFVKLHQTKLLRYLIPELEEGVGLKQNYHHIYTVFDHLLLSLKFCPSADWRVRFASLLHDIAKPRAMRKIDDQTTFYNHEYLGEKMSRKIMQRLKFANDDIDKVTVLVRNHMFYYNVGEVTPASVRRLLAKVGEQNLQDLINIRVADRLGSGTPKAIPYKLRHLQYMFDKVRYDPVSVKMLKINGTDLMQELNLAPGPKIGALLDVLLGEVIEEPDRNTKERLLKRAQDLAEQDLATLRSSAKAKIYEKQEAEDQTLKYAHRV